MKRAILIAAAGVVLLACAAVAGYYYRERQELHLFVNALLVDRNLEESRLNFAVIHLLDKGETERAMALLHSLMLGDLHLASVAASVDDSGRLKEEVQAHFTKVRDHYEKYPKYAKDNPLWESLKEAILKGEPIK